MRTHDGILIAPSILSADFGHLEDEVADISADADLVHVDVMDGHFVPNLTIGPAHVAALKQATDLPLDVHLMIDNPLVQLPWYLDAGADGVTVHLEACHGEEEALACAATVRAAGAAPALAINPETPVAAIGDALLPAFDMFLVMSVHPGFSGQSFIEDTPGKVRELAGRLAAADLVRDIEVDGGIGVQTAPLVAAAGAGVLVAGNAVFKAADRGEAIEAIREAADSARPDGRSFGGPAQEAGRA